jgi:hypothetical protein
MKHDFYYSIKTLHEFYGFGFCKKIDIMILRKREDEVMRKIFDVG